MAVELDPLVMSRSLLFFILFVAYYVVRLVQLSSRRHRGWAYPLRRKRGRR